MALYRFPQNSKSLSRTEIFYELVAHIENFLIEYYRFSHAERVRDFAIISNECERPFLQIQPINSEEMEIGVVFVEQWIEAQSYHSSLDCLLAVLEEISHFHTLISCVHRGRELSREDLESQSEVDKVIFLLDAERKDGRLLNKQRLQSSAHSIIFHALFESDLYRRASNRADSLIAGAIESIRHVKHPSLEDLRSYLSDRHPGLRKVA